MPAGSQQNITCCNWKRPSCDDDSMLTSHDDVIAERLATQRLTSVGHLSTVDVVRELCCVQSQDAPLARYSIGLRLRDATENDVRAAIIDHQIIRTHILRTTWHYVASEDLRWILALTSPRVIASMRGRWSRLGLEPAIFRDCEEVLNEILSDGQTLTRPELAAHFVQRGLPGKGEQLTHLIMRAELVGQICGGGLSADQHTYGLLEQLVAPAAARDRDAAVRDLVIRFITGHGPATERDIARYATLTVTDIRGALADLAGELVRTELDGQILWSNPVNQKTTADQRAFLLPTFDEAFLAFVQPNFLRTAGHPRGDEPPSFSEAAAGLVVLDRFDVGVWRRKLASQEVIIDIKITDRIDIGGRDEITLAAHRLAAFVGRPARLVWA